MAEFVQQSIEEMLPELEQMERVGLFTTSETRAILRKRKAYEYKLRRKTKQKEDYLQYAQYEINVLALVRKRREKIGYKHKRLEIDLAMVHRINRLFRLAEARFKDDVKLWLSHIEFNKQRGAKDAVSKLFTKMIQIHNKKPALWIAAAKWEMEEGMSMENARSLLQRAIRFNPSSKKLWIEYFRMELLNADKLRKRREVLGLAQLDKDEEGISEAVLEGCIATVVFKKATEAFPDDVEFWLEFIPVCQLFDFTEWLEEDIFQGLQERKPDNEFTWDGLAKRPLKRAALHAKQSQQDKKKKEDAIINLEEECWKIYERAVQVKNTAVHSGQFSIVLTSPEVLLHENWKKVWLSNVYQTKCCLLAVDEAHCLTEWGNSEFRPHFRSIVKVRHILGKPCLLTTATLSTALYKDILNAMDLNAAEVVDVAIIPDRPNIFLHMRLGMAHYEIELDELISELQENQTKTPKTIIFCRNLPAVGQLHTYMMGRLDDKGAAYVGEHIPANALIRQYYAKVGSKVQKEITVNFAQPTSNLRVLITTVGFGMGVDIPDVKRIIHWGISNNPVWYWQEIGRAGRSGEESTALMYALPMTLSQKFVSNEMKDIVSSVKQGECVRATILNHLCLPSMNGVEKLLSEMKNRKGCTEAHQGEECGCECCKCCNVCREKCLCVKL